MYAEADGLCPLRGLQRQRALGDRAGARLKHADADLVGRQAVERIDNRLDRTLHIALDEHRIFDDLRLVGERFEHALQADRRLNSALLARLALAIGRDLPGARLVIDALARVALTRGV